MHDMQPTDNPSHLRARARLATLGQFIILVFLATLFFYLRILESETHREEFESMMALASFQEFPIHKVLVKQHESDKEFQEAFDLNIQDSVIKWLGDKDPTLDKNRRKSRQLVVDWLKKNGLTSREASHLSGKGSRDSASDFPALFFHSGLEPLNTQFKNEAKIGDNPPIGLLLQEIKHLATPVTLSVVTEIDPSKLPTLNFRVSCNGQEGFCLKSVRLKDDDKLIITFIENEAAQQGAPSTLSHDPPVVTQQVSGVNLLEIISEGIHSTRLVALPNDLEVFNHLIDTYANVRLKDSQDLTRDLMLKSFQDIGMLGFNFSPKHFWIFVFAFLMVALIASILQLNAPLSKADDTPSTFGLHLLIDRLIFRVLLWCLLPVSAMLLAIPRRSFSIVTMASYWSALVILLITGVYLVWLSLRASKESEETECHAGDQTV